MAKGAAHGKSSATSATRKKHARKAAGPTDTLPLPLPKEKKDKKGKVDRNAPRQKVYLPPSKPVPARPDPIDALGLGQVLPPELLVPLRSLKKKDALTKSRALEDIARLWVEPVKSVGGDGEEEREAKAEALVQMLPVWIYHLPALLLHPARRVRLLTATLHASLLSLPATRAPLLTLARETQEPVLGAWSMSAHDPDRLVASASRASWADAHRFGLFSDGDAEESRSRERAAEWAWLQRSVLDPADAYAFLNPPAPAPPPPPGHTQAAQRGKRQNHQPPRRAVAATEEPARAKDEEESEQDRHARLRIGALGAIASTIGSAEAKTQSDAARELLANPLLWTSLCATRASPLLPDPNAHTPAFGFEQPGVRRAAWALVRALVRPPNDPDPALTRTLSVAVLRAAWIEPDAKVREVMWEPLLLFLKEHPEAWTASVSVPPSDHEHGQERGQAEEDGENGGSDREEDGSDGEEETGVGDADADANVQSDRPGPGSDNGNPAQGPPDSPAYREFLQFLELGCGGSPVQGYPAIVVVLSTIPSELLRASDTTADVENGHQAPYSDVFASLWAAVDGGALRAGVERNAASLAFLSALFDCLLFLARRLLRASDRQADAKRLFTEHCSRAWDALCDGSLRCDHEGAMRVVAKALDALQQVDGEVFRETWDALATRILAPAETVAGSEETARTQMSMMIMPALRAFSETFAEDTVAREAFCALLASVCDRAVERLKAALDVQDAEALYAAVDTEEAFLANLLEAHQSAVSRDEHLMERVSAVVRLAAERAAFASAPLLLAYMRQDKEDDNLHSLWQTISRALGAWRPAFGHLDRVKLLLTAPEASRMESPPPPGNELEEPLSEALLGNSAEGSAQWRDFVCAILRAPDAVVSDAVLSLLLDKMMVAFKDADARLSYGKPAEARTNLILEALGLLSASKPAIVSSAAARHALLPSVFLYGHLLARCSGGVVDAFGATLGRTLWEQWLSQAGPSERATAAREVVRALKIVLADASTVFSSEHVLRTLQEDCGSMRTAVLDEFFADPSEFDAMLDKLPHGALHSSIAVDDILAFPASADVPNISPSFDGDGLSGYARYIGTVIPLLLDDRQLAKQNPWVLRHILALGLYAKDALACRSISNPIFEQDVSVIVLQDLITKANQLAAFVLTTTSDSDTKAFIQAATDADIKSLSTKYYSASAKSRPASLIASIVAHAKERDSSREARTMYAVLSLILRSADRQQADEWIGFARVLDKSAPETAMAITVAISECSLEPPRLDRLRNELAANMLGVRPRSVNTEGLRLLRRLVASAPDPESDVVFLPQQRAVNVIKACQTWIAGDDDADEEKAGEEGLEATMTLLFAHLAPILQDVPGAHWDFMFDVVENNLEEASFKEPDTLVTLARSLRFVLAVQDLAATNKELRATWAERESRILQLVRDAIAQCTDTSTSLASLSTCRELALSVLQSLPQRLVEPDTLQKMCHLVTDASVDVQKMSYQVLQEPARKRTEHLVVEAGVDTEGTFKAELPAELVALLSTAPDSSTMPSQMTFGYLLAWMVAFDLFADSSLRVKSGYVEQLRNLDVVGTELLPCIWSLLGLYGGLPKALKLSMWAIEEYYVQLYDPDSPVSLPVLAAHVYYRALLVVPSLIRTWVADCKDRTLSRAVTTYTSTHFSPALLDTELVHLRSAEIAEDDENMKVKVARATAEVTASYTVDEHQLELTVKLPADWPLHGIEIRDEKRVGVLEDRWRSWVLGVFVLAQNGSIVDGLSLFKKNVAAHFEGQVECAICYSVISPLDGTLPRKPCKTCKNRFHAGCLYKWFDSSHSSSCPLCRSNINIF